MEKRGEMDKMKGWTKKRSRKEAKKKTKNREILTTKEILKKKDREK